MMLYVNSTMAKKMCKRLPGKEGGMEEFIRKSLTHEAQGRRSSCFSSSFPPHCLFHHTASHHHQEATSLASHPAPQTDCSHQSHSQQPSCKSKRWPGAHKIRAAAGKGWAVLTLYSCSILGSGDCSSEPKRAMSYQ